MEQWRAGQDLKVLRPLRDDHFALAAFRASTYCRPLGAWGLGGKSRLARTSGLVSLCKARDP
jgi:hypothetical protein